MYSLSWESCSLFVLMYCQRAWMMAERVCVWIPSRRASRGSSLNWGGCNRKPRRWQYRGKQTDTQVWSFSVYSHGTLFPRRSIPFSGRDCKNTSLYFCSPPLVFWKRNIVPAHRLHVVHVLNNENLQKDLQKNCRKDFPFQHWCKIWLLGMGEEKEQPFLWTTGN